MKDQRLFDEAEKIINLAWDVAEIRGIMLTDVHFDKGELIQEREIHILRFFAGEQTANVHFHRLDIERFNAPNGIVPVCMKILGAIDKLHEEVTATVDKFVVPVPFQGHSLPGVS